MLAQAQPA
jgi:hypothetical protein